MTRTLSIFLPAALAAVVASPWPQSRTASAAEPAPEPRAVKPKGTVEYNRDVRPILTENCFACHGPDSAARKANLRIDRREDAIETKAIVPGKPGESELITRICSEDESEIMPPPKTKKKLTPAQKETLRKWIAEGAEY